METQFDADVIVVGSGALGANAAYELARQGKSVIILEAGRPHPALEDRRELSQLVEEAELQRALSQRGLGAHLLRRGLYRQYRQRSSSAPAC